MLLQNDEIIIRGVTSNGKIFRPGDWAERLCGILSSFDKDRQLSCYEWVKPVSIQNVRCIVVSKNLAKINPAMFRFLMDFAVDNDLSILESKDFSQLQQQKNGLQVVDQSAHTHEIFTKEITAKLNEKKIKKQEELREICPDETASAFAALSVLRPTLNDINRFTEQVNQIQRVQGYRLLGIFEAEKTNAVSVCGFSERTDLLSGRYIFIEDLVTVPQSRRLGYASQLLDKVRQIAETEGIMQIHVDCHVGSERTVAHHFYFQQNFEIQSYHFVNQTQTNN